MVFGQWFQRKDLRIAKKMHKITHNSIKLGVASDSNKIDRGVPK